VVLFWLLLGVVLVSTVKVDGELKNELTRLQSSFGGDRAPSLNDVVRRAVSSQSLAPLLMRYINARIDDWNPYDLLSWYYDEMMAPMERGLVETYAQLVVELRASLGDK
jgi:hypothetical protein